MAQQVTMQGEGKARRVVCVDVCDFCCDREPGHDEVVAVETISFALDGGGYELDVCERHADHVRDTICPLIGMARRAGTRAPAPRGAGTRRSRRDPAAYERTCPECKAKPGQRCVRPSGWESGEPHAARRRAEVDHDAQALPL